MSEQHHHVVFKGQISDDANVDTVKQKLAALFKINIAQAEAMLGGKPIYIKKNVDLATAKKYQAAMQKAGAVADIISPTSNAEKAAPKASTGNNTANKSSAVILPGSAASSAVPETEAPQTQVSLSADADIAGISMAATGADLQTTPNPISTPEFDLSELSMAAAGEGTLSKEQEKVTVDIDTSDLSLE